MIFLFLLLINLIALQRGFLKENMVDELPKLSAVTIMSDRAFCRLLSLDLNKYLMYRKRVHKNLEFAAQFKRWIETGTPINMESERKDQLL